MINLASILGLLDMVLAIGYAIFVLSKRVIRNPVEKSLSRIQDVTALILFLVGRILIFDGWRLDPILLFAVFLLHVLIFYVIAKDSYLFRLLHNNNPPSSQSTEEKK